MAIDWGAYEFVKSRLRELLEKRARTLAFQVRIWGLEEGDKPTSYFFQAMKARRSATAIPGLRGTGGLVTEVQEMLGVAEAYHKDLFSEAMGRHRRPARQPWKPS